VGETQSDSPAWDSNANIPEFSYAVSGDTITHNGVSIERSGTVAGGSVTFTTTLPANASFAAGSSTTEVLTFNSDRLVTEDALTLNEGSGQPTTATTSYEYQDATGRYDNGAPKSSKVTKVTNPDGSWVGYTYDDKTGWVTRQITPFMSSTWSPSNDDAGDTSGDRVEQYVYLPADPTQVQPGDEFTGEAADPNNLVERPREVIDSVEGIQTAETFNRYGGNTYGAVTIQSRQALTSDNATWATTGLFSKTLIAAFDASKTTSVLGDTSTIKYGPNSSLGYQTASDWFGSTRSQSNATLNAFGYVTSSSQESLSSDYRTDTVNTFDAFGRPLTQTLTGGLTETSNYTNPDGTTSWFGPASVVGTDGAMTKYTYTPLGQIATKTIFAETGHSVRYTYIYDAAGHVVSVDQTAVDTNGNFADDPTGDPTSLTDTYAYDAQGRLTQQVSDSGGSDSTANKTTAYAYSFDGTYNITSVTNADGSTDVTKTYLDGTAANFAGTDQTPGTESEGVVANDTTDANGNIETAGSTWVMTSSDGGKNWTKSFTNVVGETYLVQQSNPSTATRSTERGIRLGGQCLGELRVLPGQRFRFDRLCRCPAHDDGCRRRHVGPADLFLRPIEQAHPNDHGEWRHDNLRLPRQQRPTPIDHRRRRDDDLHAGPHRPIPPRLDDGAGWKPDALCRWLPIQRTRSTDQRHGH
jgi:hypothetical protein